MSDTPAAESGRPVGLVVGGGGVDAGLRGRDGVAFLMRPDGSVLIPAPLAGEVMRALVRDLTTRVRADGGEVSPAVRSLVRALHVSAVRSDVPVTFADETPSDLPVTVIEVTTEQAAELLGCSAQYARHLARSGRVAARRVGRVWLLDRESLDAFRTGGVP
ncbi:helix-turn-helix domain-containing protein [Streptomyces chartreusis]